MYSWHIYLRISSWFLLIVMLLVACNQSKPPSPDPQAVLEILRQYPGGTLVEDRMPKNEGDFEYLLSFATQTTLEAAVAHYDPLLRTLGMEGYTPQGAIRNNFPVDYLWRYSGCPYHGVELSITSGSLQITYGYGPCR